MFSPEYTYTGNYICYLDFIQTNKTMQPDGRIKMKTENSKSKLDVLLTYPSDGMRLFESMMPLGIASIAASVLKAGFSVEIIDFNNYDKDFRMELLAKRPRIVGIGGTTATRSGSFKTATMVKQVLPSATVVYGGPHATFCAADSLINIPSIDFVIKGEGEFSFVKLCKNVIRKEAIPFSEIEGLARRVENSIIENPTKRIDDLSQLPLPARDLFEHVYPLTIDHTDIHSDFLVTSRGCPATCDFCSASKLFPGGVRLRPMVSVAKEIDWIIANRKEVRGLKLFDSTFTAVRSHVEEFCEIISSRKLKWECEIRADTVDFALLKMMRDAGCCFMSMGLETTDPVMLKKIGKRITSEQADKVIGWCRQLGIIIKVFFTFGHIGQTLDECETDLTWMGEHREKIDFFATTFGIRVYPGTIVETKIRRAGMIPENFSWAKFRAPKRNLLVGEPADVMIVEQPSLPLHMLSWLILRTAVNRTILSRSYIFKMIVSNVISLKLALGKQIMYTRHMLKRKLVYRVWY